MTPFLAFQSLSKSFGRVCALNKVSFGFESGSVVALLGPNGAGKSTLFSCLFGFIRPNAGTILHRGQPITPSVAGRFGYLSERVSLYPNLTVRENLLFFADLKGHSYLVALDQLRRLRLEAVAGRRVRELSKGMLQRLGLAIALGGEPELLVLDEPFNGLDPALLDEFSGILREEKQRGATLLISTHTLSAIEPLATQVVILLYGNLLFNGSLESLRSAYGSGRGLESIYQQIAREHYSSLAKTDVCA